MGKIKDLTGQKFGRLTVLELAGKDKWNGAIWKCLCDCKNTVNVVRPCLESGNTKSCGCYNREAISKRCLMNLTGHRFGRLTVLSRNFTKQCKQTYWDCKCDCGNTAIIMAQSLKRGLTRSCGCLQRELVTNSHKTHCETGTRLHRIWLLMKDRCHNSKTPSYKNYGGRGISVCEEWHEYVPFRDWALSHGYVDNLTIERIGVNGNYEPSNCKWVTWLEQARNKRNTLHLTYHNESKTLGQWADEYKISYKLLYNRVFKKKWQIKKALTTPS